MARGSDMRTIVIQPYGPSSYQGRKLLDAPLVPVRLVHRGSGREFEAVAFLDSGCDRTSISSSILARIETELGAVGVMAGRRFPFDIIVTDGRKRFLLKTVPGVSVAPNDRFADQEDVLVGRDIMNGRRVDLDGLAEGDTQARGVIFLEVSQAEELGGPE